MIQIYHNPRCRKSREGVALLEEKNITFEIIKYLDNPLNEAQITTLLTKLNMQPLDVVRKNEALWKTNYKGKPLTDKAVITALANNPKLIERPIVVNGNKAVIARPTDLILNLI